MTQRRLPPPRTPDPRDAPPVRWGVLAPGWIAGMFCAALRRGTDQQIVAVASRNLDRAQAFATKYGAPTAYGSYDELVADPDVDIVYVASPHSEHHRQARLALEAGKPVLVEKAFTRNAAEARDLVDLARSRGLFLLEGMWSRFLPHYDVIAQAIGEGLIGEVTTVFADHGQNLFPGGPTRLSSPDLAGGALLDLGVYPISFADFALGPFAAITATGTLTDRGVDAQESVTVATASGALGVLHSGMLAATPTTASVCGTDGRLDVDGPFYCPARVRLRDRDGVVVDEYDPVRDIGDVAHQSLRYEAAEAARCVTDGAGESAQLPLATTLRVMEALDTVRHQLGVRYPGE